MARKRALALSLRGKFKTWKDISGADQRYAAALSGNLVPAVDPEKQGGHSLEATLGSRLLVGHHRLALEASIPLYQNLNGPRLEADLTLTLGWQFDFD